MESSQIIPKSNKSIQSFFCNSLPLGKAAKILPRMRPSLMRDYQTVQIENLEFRINRSGGVLLDGNEVVGSIGRLNELAVMPEYRGRGLAVKMIILWAMANPWYQPRKIVYRTQHGAAAYREAWNTVLKDFYVEK